VVTGDEKDRDTGQMEFAHRPDEIQPRAHVLPVAVEQVPGEDNEIHRFVDRPSHQSVERRSGRAPDFRFRQPLVAGQAVQRAIQMDVSGVEKSEVGH
jgi:hypothetical protein